MMKISDSLEKSLGIGFVDYQELPRPELANVKIGSGLIVYFIRIPHSLLRCALTHFDLINENNRYPRGITKFILTQILSDI